MTYVRYAFIAICISCSPEVQTGAVHAAPDSSTVQVSGCSPASGCAGCNSCEAECACKGQDASWCCGVFQPLTGDASANLSDSGPPRPIPSGPVTLQMDAFDVGPGQEKFTCQNFSNPFGRDVDVLQSESFMTPGSHHLFASHVAGITDGPLEDCSGIEFHPTLHSAQVPHLKMTYPPGVGRFLIGTEGIRILTHYLNTGTSVVHADVRVELTAVDPATIETQASYVFMNTMAIDIAPHTHGTATGSCPVPNDIELIFASSHMHQRGVHFIAKAEDGTTLYETTQWSDPAPARYDPPLHVPGGTSITWTCDYDNTTDMTLTFGQSAVTNEMCIFGGIYYPAPQGAGIQCF